MKEAEAMSGESHLEAGQRSLRLIAVMPTYNRWEKARVSLGCLMKSDYRNFEIVLVEDNCTDGTVEKCRAEFPDIHILHGDGNLWWSGGANKGIEYALSEGADLILLINDDNNVEPQTVGKLVEGFLRQGEKSVICSRIRLRDSDEPEWRGRPPTWHPEHHTWQTPEFGDRAELPIEHPPGGQGVLISAACFREVGLLDRANFPMNWADHNFHYRAMKAGYKYYIAAGAIIWNYPNVEARKNRDIFTLRGAWWFLTNNKHSYGNMKALRRHLKIYLPPREYRKTFYPILWRHLLWLGHGWLKRKPLLHKPLSAIKRSILPNKTSTTS
jgi:GT2 family glycosyltransferase